MKVSLSKKEAVRLASDRLKIWFPKEVTLDISIHDDDDPTKGISETAASYDRAAHRQKTFDAVIMIRAGHCKSVLGFEVDGEKRVAAIRELRSKLNLRVEDAAKAIDLDIQNVLRYIHSFYSLNGIFNAYAE